MRITTAALIVLIACACASAQTPAPPAAPAFDGARAFEHLKNIVAIGPRPAGSPGTQKTRAYIRQEMTKLGAEVTEQPFDAQTPAGVVRMTNVSVTFPGPGTGSPDHRWPLRHQALQRVRLRRGKRCRIQHRVSHRAGPRAEGAHQRDADRVALPRRRRSDRRMGYRQYPR